MIDPMLQAIAPIELVLCWVAWSLAFVRGRRPTDQKKGVRAPASKWGIVLEMVGFALAWAYIRPSHFDKSSPAPALIVSMVLGPASVVLAWTAVRHLGRHWRFEAALSEDHELVQTGPYRWLRHPIYASMLGMLLATGAAWTWWPIFIAALLVFLVGTEIRVHAEDRLLAERFGEDFVAYRSRTRVHSVHSVNRGRRDA